ncbi:MULTISPECIES: AAA family ATPase [Cyanophyceae]|uniref:AAA family ATPase n=1 Tax=Cyanophyceae TaxID=3028117 RepID=UPI0016841E02|nr:MULTISPECIES: AAA family ATPase [Cyanophyceae]MBD1919457.1 AAA family ATPase [Phormidium sp. FACHB-77]MBD2054309.1 AAA family ATPase [Leptolyngbya sp. FACHB-60]
MTDWKIFQGSQDSADEKLKQLLSVEAPSWRQFIDAEKAAVWDDKTDEEYLHNLQEIAAKKTRDIQRGERFRLRIAASPPPTSDPVDAEMPESLNLNNEYDEVIEAVNAGLYLRRPLMIAGRPGSGKTSLAYAIAHELNLGPVLLWPITARSVLKDGLYQYDAIARLQDAQLSEQMMKVGQSSDVGKVAADFKKIGQYIRLGPVGTAFLPSKYPRVLLIDEIDKSDINLPNELLNLFEEGEFEIPELKRLSKAETSPQEVETDDGLLREIPKGKVRCREFPIIIMTSNAERDFPPAFYRRCLRVAMPNPSKVALKEIVKAHLGPGNVERFNHVIQAFVDEQNSDEFSSLPTDQLLNLIYLFAKQPQAASQNLEKSTLKKLLFNPTDNMSGGARISRGGSPQ